MEIKPLLQCKSQENVVSEWAASSSNQSFPTLIGLRFPSSTYLPDLNSIKEIQLTTSQECEIKNISDLALSIPLKQIPYFQRLLEIFYLW